MPGGINDVKKVKKNSVQTVIPSQATISDELKKVPIWNEGQKVNKQSYLDNVILNSYDDNLKLIHIADRKLKNVPKPNFKTYEPPQTFKQKLPSASKDKKTVTAEKNKITELKNQGFEDADYCTAREYTALTEYFKEDPNKEIKSPMDLDNPELKDYVDQILSMKLDLASITDDYLSNHISELIGLVKNLEKLDGYKKSYPEFFKSLGVDESIELETKLYLKDSLNQFLTDHLALHGIDLKQKNGKSTGVSLIKSDKNKSKAQKKQEKTRKSDQTANDRTALIRRIQNQEFVKATLYTSRSLRSENELEALDKLIGKEGDPKIYAEFKNEILYAYGEIKKLLLLRNDELAKQKRNITRYDLAGKEEEKACRKDLAKTNAKLDLLTKNIGHYKYFLRCVEGDPMLPVVSKETMDFFEKEKQGAIIDVIRVRMMGDYTVQCIHTAKRLEKQQRIAELEKKTGDKNAQAELKKLRQELDKESGEKKMENPRGKLLEFRNAKRLSEIVNLKENESRKSAILDSKKFKDYETKNHLNQVPDRTFNTITDPLHTRSDEELFWYALAANNSPLKTEKKNGPTINTVSEEVRKEIVDKGLMPMLKRFLSINPGNIMSLKRPENPDFKDPAFWENLSLVGLGFVMPEFLSVLERWGVKLTDKEIIHLTAFGKTVEQLSLENNNYLVRKVGTPMHILYDTPDFKKYAFTIQKDVAGYSKPDPYVEKYQSRHSGATMWDGNKTIPMKGYIQITASMASIEDSLEKTSTRPDDLFELNLRRYEVLPKLKIMKTDVENKRKTIMGRSGNKPAVKEKKELQTLEKEEAAIDEAIDWLDSNFEIKNPSEETKAFLKKNGLYVETPNERKAKRAKGTKNDQKPVKQSAKKKSAVIENEPLNIIKEVKTGKKEYKAAATKALKREAGKYATMPLKPVKLVPDKGYYIDIEPGFKYERQGTNNCYACSGAALFNQFIANKDGKLVEPFGQMDIRSYEPQIKSYEDFKKLAGKIMKNDATSPTDDQLTDDDFQQMYDDYKKHLTDFTGKDKQATGNIFELGDFFISKRDDVVVNRMTFSTPATKTTMDKGKKKTKQQIDEDNLLYKNQKEVFLDQINKILKTGNLVSILNRIGDRKTGSYDHYRTIAGIKGKTLKVYDSTGSEKPQYLDIEELLPRKTDGNVVEITWLSELKSPKDMIKEFPSLKYDEKNGYSENESVAEPSMESALNLGQTRGTLVKKYTREAEQAAYIPKKGTKYKLPKYDLKPLYGQGKDAVRKTDSMKKDSVLKKESIKQPLQTAKIKTTTKAPNKISSSEMQTYKRDMQTLMDFMNQKMPPLSFDDKDAVDFSCLMAATLYNKVIESIDICLSNPSCFNNNENEKKQLLSSKNRCKKESETFREQVFEYREMIKTSKNTGKVKNGLTWYDALHYERADIYNINGQNGVAMEKVGERTSNLYKLTRQNKAKQQVTVFFEKEEKVASKSNTQLVKDFLAEIEEDEEYKVKYLKPVFEGLLKDAEQNRIGRTDFTNYMIGIVTQDPQWDLMYRMLLKDGSNAIDALDELPPEELKNVCGHLLNMAKKVAQRYAVNTPRIKSGRNLSDRNVATSRMAELLGIQDIVCDSRTAYVRNKDKYIKGNLMEDAGGKNANDLMVESSRLKRKIRYTPGAINQIFTMQIFDFICGQTDRHHRNFHLKYREKGSDELSVTAIRAIDNNMSFGVLKYKDTEANERYKRMSVNSDYLYGMPVKLLNSIVSLEEETLKYMLMDILDKEELQCLCDRIKGLQEEIKKLPGLENNNGIYSYINKKENDDAYRQSVVLKKYMETYGKTLGVHTNFIPTFIDRNAVNEKAEKNKN